MITAGYLRAATLLSTELLLRRRLSFGIKAGVDHGVAAWFAADSQYGIWKDAREGPEGVVVGGADELLCVD